MRKGIRAFDCRWWIAALGLLINVAAFAGAVPAFAKEPRLLKSPIGHFTFPKGVAVDEETHDVYVIDGRSEEQVITVSATAGSFRLKFGGEDRELDFDATSEEVRTALREIVCGDASEECLTVVGGPGGSQAYRLLFGGARLATTEVDQVECEDGIPPLSGGSGCTAITTTEGVNGSISRYHADGTLASFSALGSNAIDARGPGADLTPQEGLHFLNADRTQVAVDNSGGLSDGNIYVTQFFGHLVDVFAPSGEFLGQLTEYEDGAVFKPLDGIRGVAVDSAGGVFAGALSSLIHKYEPTGNPVVNSDSSANFPFTGASTLAAGAGPTAGFLFASSLFDGLYKIDATTGEEKYKVDSNNTTVTVDPLSGHVLTANGNEVREYDASGASSATLLGTIAAGSTVTGVGVDGSTGSGGTVYVARAGATHLDVYGPFVKLPDALTGAASEIKGTTATLNGSIGADDGPSATCEFEYLNETAYQANIASAKEEGKNPTEIKEAAFAGAEAAPCEPAGPFSGSSVQAVSGEATGLSAGTEYEFRIVGENANGKSPGGPEGFRTAGPPVIKGGEVSEITTETAKISGEVNPATLDTSFWVDYVSAAEFDEAEYNSATSVPVPPQDIGSANGFVEVSQLLKELVPGTTYRFRLVAENEAGTTLGEDHQFTTFLPPTGLLDARAYEQVSPSQKLGEVFPPEPGPRTGLGGGCTACIPGWNKQKAPMQVSPDGNAVAYEGSPFSAGLAAGANEYVAKRDPGGWHTSGLSSPQFRDDSLQGFKAFSSDLSRAILYQIKPSLTPEAPTDFANLYLQDVEEGGLTALITAQPPNRLPANQGPDSFRVDYAGANAGTPIVAPLSHVIFQANDALTEEVAGVAPKAPAVGGGETNLYEWSGGQLELVNVLPGSTAAAPNAVIGSGLLMANGGENFAFDHAISDDGSRIFWSEKPSGQVYVREDGATTIEVPDPGKFLTASTDGSKVLLNSGRVYDLEDETLTDLTGGVGGFVGMVGTSEDLARIYFVDTKALTAPSEVNGNPAGPEHAEEGEFNLYLWEEGAVPHEGETRFIGKLLEQDNNVGLSSVGTWRASAGSRLAQTTPDGRFLVFSSRGRLTGYDNTVRGGGTCRLSDPSAPGCPQVFEYDADEGSLVCPSCNPSGARPLAGSNLALIRSSTDFLPELDNLPPAGEGRLFFESQDVLSPADTNGRIQDVYEWEPNGVGLCRESGGCLALISSGHYPKDSHFVNASATGDDVFFTTREALVPQDKDGDFMDLYDARVGGGFPEEPIVDCSAETCPNPQPPPPPDPTAGSAGLIAPPNPKYCKKGFVKKHGKCVKKKHKKKPHKNKKPHKSPAKQKSGGSK